MKDDFLGIVELIVRHMSDEDGAGPAGRHIIEALMDEGYDLMDVDDALSWLESLAESGDDLHGTEITPGFTGIRVQAPSERAAMTPEAFGYLMRLNRAGIIGDALRESLIDKVVGFSSPGFGIDQMRTLLGLVIYAGGGDDDGGYRLTDGGAGRLPH